MPTPTPTGTLSPTPTDPPAVFERSRAPEPRKTKRPTRTPTPTPTPTPIFSTCSLLPPSVIVRGYHPVTQCRQVDHRGVGISEVINAGIVDAVDVWAYIPPDLEICFRNRGSLVILAAENMPRFAEPLPWYLRGGMTCALINRAGTVVLLHKPLFPGGAVAAPVTPSSTIPTWSLQNCMVTLQYDLNFRDAPAGNIMDALPAFVRLTALERTAGWFKVDFHGRRGWVSADYVTPDGAC
ncbi:MAG: SH3 domain-containing protein [Chloroflexi bacterium]|nr:SH3 domain-containing protein [Chloroflexota bacterium]